MICEDNDFIYPMTADIFYATVEQSPYGQVMKTWNVDRSVICNFTPAGTKFRQEVKPNVDLTQISLLLGRVKTDLRKTERELGIAITNIVVSNIVDRSGNELYVETSGPRYNKSTIFEIATFQPIVGPFGDIDYYEVVLRRSENQGTDV